MEQEIEYCPILKPNMKEFSDFRTYVLNLEKQYAENYGMVKVVAPRSWRPRKQDYEQSIETSNIPNPIEQNVFGKGGIYECLHIIKNSMQVKDFVKKSHTFNKITEGLEVEDIEKLFYKNISFSPPIYGADFLKSLFDQDCSWNLSNLDNFLKDGLGGQIAGVNSPYLYMGHWKSFFAWHTEDMDLAAINYLHYGKPKFWYALPASEGPKLEQIAKEYFPESFKKCPEHLRHKTTLINPYLLKKRFPDLKIHKMVHNPREFIIVFYKSYHHGFNFGFNIAESCNFATPNWLQYFINAKHCLCENSQVKIQKKEFITNLFSKNSEYKNDPKVQEFMKQINYNNNENTNIDISSEEEEQSTKDTPLQQKVPIIKKKIQKTKINKKNIKNNQNKTEETQKQQENEQQIIIDDYIQCDKCLDWRQLDKKKLNQLKKKEYFECSDIKQKCQRSRNLRSRVQNK